LTPYQQLRGKVAVVTGGNRGVGAGIAEVLCQCGMRVMIVARDRELNEKKVGELIANGGEAASCFTDVAEEEQVRAAAAATLSRFGALDVLVNNAGLDPRDHWREIDVATWDRIQAVNVKGYYLCAKHMVPPMLRQRWGRVINITSSTVFEGNVGALHYVTSKAANIGFTRALAKELARTGITVNAVAPGAVETPKEMQLGDVDTCRRILAQILDRQLVEGRIQPTDIGWLVAYLCTEPARFLTGQTINIDGGRRFQ
jgi:3-oxoacyl-[acyl-carrier protein] reductase